MSKTTFRTLDGREYDLALNFGILRKVDGWDFSSVAKDAPKLLELETDDELRLIYHRYSLAIAYVFAILWVKGVFPPEIEQTEAETRFLESLDGKTAEAARDALWAALMDFSPSRQSNALRRLQTADQAGIRELEANAERLEAANEQIVRQAIRDEIEKQEQRAGRPSGVSVPSSAGAGATSATFDGATSDGRTTPD